MQIAQQLALAAALALAAGGFLWAAASDLRRYLIPNLACALVGAGYLLSLAATPIGPWLAGLAVAGAGFGLALIAFARGSLGGGDVKLGTAALLWAGTAHLSDFALVTALTGAGLAVFMLTPARRLLPAAPEGAQSGLRQPMPMGVAIAAGGLWVAWLHLTPAG
jgi:prepilin peptidase CpaA